jgi:ubiquinone/menaquinone biosynthesis C-methylase UbiE
MIRLNLGAGAKPIKGFINVDIQDFGKNYVKADVRKLPFKDNYADYILASEILEHIPLRDVKKTLEEWIRVLKPGGRMIIKVPDFDALVKEWSMTPFHPADFGNLAQGFYGNQRTEDEYHRSPITVGLLQFYFGTMGLKTGHITTYSKGHKEISYPGIKADPKRVYRFGVIHVDLVK